ncbi:VOC family protein [Actinomadura harenae]|uniref:Glyoxalase/fosfomycin resistance/dioxygenase domain-containing protein n=1 Tax=Actinomadura harenae TaxID=2483351 RepID=A0A3M2M7F7_9ACTN|nr:VOC family protein [Actinomadura harenae]RMI44910.1 hypothetical protein EBO15_11590 [Actinomadura harenae]
MPLITKVIARIVVADLDDAIDFYRTLIDTDAVQRFTFAGIDLAGVGPFLLLAGPGADKVADRAATLVVTDLDLVARRVTGGGGVLREGPTASPNGRRLIAEHPDGAVFEYIEQPADRPTGGGESRDATRP